MRLFVVKVNDKYYLSWTDSVNISSVHALSSKDINQLKKLNKVTDLKISVYDFDDISFINNMPELEKIYLLRVPLEKFHDKEMKKPDLNCISNCKKVKDISLSICGAENLKFVSDSVSLKKYL